MPTDDLDRFCCQNAACELHGRRGVGNLSACGTFGRNAHRLPYCNACGARSSEFKGTPLFNAKPPHDKVLAVLEHLADGRGVRQTARLVGVGKDTVTRPARLAGEHAKSTHDEPVASSPRHPRGPARRGVVVRGQGAGPSRPGRAGRRPVR